MRDGTLIKDARIFDGTGAPWFRSDLLISGGRIARMAPNLAASGAAVVRAEDRYLAPGFIGRLVRPGWFNLEDAVRRMTSATAQRFNLPDRGVIREGLAADLTLFDAAIDDHATFDDPVQFGTGVSHVFVNGDAVLADGKPTGRLPGRVIP